MFEKNSIVDEFTISVGGELHLNEEMSFEDIIFEAVKFGYNKANEWHDLKKDPKDLPDTDRNVWVKRESEIECQIDNYYDDEDGKGWGIMFREGYCTDDVVAWCELPIYEEETKPNTSQELESQDILDENETLNTELNFLILES